MGQSWSHIDNNQIDNNGLLMSDKYIPEEVISQILIQYVDYKSLVNCQVVCKHWNNLIQDYIWRRKSELIVGQSLCLITDMSWIVYYQICHKKPFNRNLIKNYSGKDNLDDWLFICQGREGWTVEKPPISGVLEIPKEAQFDDKQCCFVTASHNSVKRQVIHLDNTGLSSEFFDNYHPLIEIGEWYTCSTDRPANYKCSVRLLGERNKTLDTFFFNGTISEEKKCTWQHVSFEFKNYGPGLRKIFFQHGGRDKFGLNGSKMAGASITINVHYDHLLSSMTN
ncbi:hypothetical protein HCN44_005810 [Aphidius gifuensis]|uniref:FBA domain-containing protein n=1 Tax=Aphidius gifuensis TaxID=684658 RepID=A0A835CQM2_APHGI|nr:hypothetical protein HCN44_005810 [Aphidius gifuensis]